MSVRGLDRVVHVGRVRLGKQRQDGAALKTAKPRQPLVGVGGGLLEPVAHAVLGDHAAESEQLWAHLVAPQLVDPRVARQPVENRHKKGPHHVGGVWRVGAGVPQRRAVKQLVQKAAVPQVFGEIRHASKRCQLPLPVPPGVNRHPAAKSVHGMTLTNRGSSAIFFLYNGLHGKSPFSLTRLYHKAVVFSPSG